MWISYLQMEKILGNNPFCGGSVGTLGIISLIFGLNIETLSIDFLKTDIHMLKPIFVYFLIGM